MKAICYPLALIIILLGLNSCYYSSEPYSPPPEPWLCSINADGTGFRKIMKAPFNTPGLVDIYMTKDNKIIFYGDKLWISDTDVINPVQITPDNLTLTDLPPRISQTPDGSKLFFAADKNIYQLSYPDYQLTQLTNQTTRWLRNPIVSDLGNYITYTSNGYGYPAKETEYLYCMDILTGTANILPTQESIIPNGLYNEADKFVIYEGDGLKRMKIDGTDVALIEYGGGSGFSNTIFSLSHDKRFVVRDGAYLSQNNSINVNDLITGSKQVIPAANGPGIYALGKLSRTANHLFYVKPDNTLCVYNLDTSTNTVLFTSTSSRSIYRFNTVAPSWDGSKVYFDAEICER